jgi:hypothetical protein
VAFDIAAYQRGRRTRKAYGVTPRQARGPPETHELSKIRDAAEQKDLVKKQIQGTCSGCSAIRVLKLSRRRELKKSTDDIPRTKRTQYWCSTCGVACCPPCFTKIDQHGGALQIPHRMGLFTRPKTKGRTGRKRPVTVNKPQANDVDGDLGMYVFFVLLLVMSLIINDVSLPCYQVILLGLGLMDSSM